METRSSSLSTGWQTLDAGNRALLEKRLQKARVAALDLEPSAVVNETETDLPLSFAQEPLWLLEKFQPGTATYNLAEILRLDGGLNIAALQQSLSEIIRRHDSLRTGFREVDGEPVQFIRPPAPVHLHLQKINGTTLQERERGAEAIIASEVRRPFDLENEPLVRVQLLQVDQNRHILLLAMHHIVTDGWSDGILISELFECYRKFVVGQPPNLPGLRLRYVDFAKWQRTWFGGSDYTRALVYWKEKLAKLPPPLKLQGNFEKPGAGTFQGEAKGFAISAQLSTRLAELSKTEGATLFMTFLAAFKILLHRHSQQNDILIGSPVANRNRLEFEKVVGCFVNMLVWRTQIEASLTFRDVLQRVRNTALEALGYQDLPFERLVMELRPERTPNVNPFFQVAFMFENFPARDLNLPSLKVSPIAAETKTSKFDLTLALAPANGGFNGAFEYKTDILDPATIDRLIKNYGALLENIASNPNLTILQLLPTT